MRICMMHLLQLCQLGSPTLRVFSVHALHYVVHTACTHCMHMAHPSQLLGQRRARAALWYDPLLTSQLGQLGLELLEAADDGGGAAPQAGEANTPRTVQHPAALLGARAVVGGASPPRGSSRRT